MVKKLLTLFLLSIIYSYSMIAQNYDESKIPSYTIPKLLESESGARITSSDQWENQRRQEILNLFKEEMYGKVPQFDYKTASYKRSIKNLELENIATQEEVALTISNGRGQIKITMLLTLPNKVEGPVPLFLGLNFLQGNLCNPRSQ